MPILDRHVLACEKAGFLQAPEERSDFDLVVIGGLREEDPNGIAGCCARATTGHAAAPPSNVIKSRRRILHFPKPLYRQPIEVGAVCLALRPRPAAAATAYSGYCGRRAYQ
jgi:hypothetical protein